MGHSGHGPLDLTMGQQWVGPDGAHVGFEWARPSPCESHGPTVAHGNPRRDLDGLAIWDVLYIDPSCPESGPDGQSSNLICDMVEICLI